MPVLGCPESIRLIQKTNLHLLRSDIFDQVMPDAREFRTLDPKIDGLRGDPRFTRVRDRLR
jgi:hypothetical protein